VHESFHYLGKLRLKFLLISIRILILNLLLISIPLFNLSRFLVISLRMNILKYSLGALVDISIFNTLQFMLFIFFLCQINVHEVEFAMKNRQTLSWSLLHLWTFDKVPLKSRLRHFVSGIKRTLYNGIIESSHAID
jgi:hypothetical protein